MKPRKLRFPFIIGAGVVAAGILLYNAGTRINSRQTQGAVGQRDVYRNAQVNAADVNAKPGEAPVATQAILESTEFKSLASNAEFQDLLANESYQRLARSRAFLDLVRNASFAELMKRSDFTELARRGSMEELVNRLRGQESAKKLDAGNSSELRSYLIANHAQKLADNQALRNLLKDDAFQEVVRNKASSEAFARAWW